MPAWLSLIQFQHPLALIALLSLPALWFLIRLTPPAPRKLKFPSLMILRGLRSTQHSSHKSPWWLIVLRMLILIFFILFLAAPYLGQPGDTTVPRPTLVIMDQDWSTAADFHNRNRFLLDLAQQAKLESRVLHLMLTAPLKPGGPIPYYENLIGSEFEKIVRQLSPSAQAPDYKAALTLFDDLPNEQKASTLWLHSGLLQNNASGFAAGIREQSRLQIYTAHHNPTLLLRHIPLEGTRNLRFEVRRAEGPQPAQNLSLRLHDTTGRTMEIAFRLNQGQAVQTLNLETGTGTARWSRAEIAGQSSAASTYYFNEPGRAPAIGVLWDQEHQPPAFESAAYYMVKAGQTLGDTQLGGLPELIKGNRSLIMIPPTRFLNAGEQSRLQQWISGGGVLIRFASRETPKSDTLFPLPISDLSRRLGGDFSWQDALRLSAFPADSLFKALQIPDSIEVREQVLPVREVRSDERVLAELEDGTPLISARQSGDGWLIYFHTAPDPAWSGLGTSGLFIRLLERLEALPAFTAGALNYGPQPLYRLMNGRGAMEANTLSRPYTLTENSRKQDLPPGLYGSSARYQAINMSDHVEALTASDLGAYRMDDPDSRQRIISLASYCLMISFGLWLLDIIIFLWARGLLHPFHRAVVILAIMVSFPAQASDLRMATQAHLAYVKTGDSQVDTVSRQAMDGLGFTLNTRTAYAAAESVGVDLARDELAFFPWIYWPLPRGVPQLSPATKEKLRAYLNRGGVILFDLQTPAAVSLEHTTVLQLLQDLNIHDLRPLPKDHVLRRAFYILQDFPGRWHHAAPLYISAPNEDGLSSVIIGQNNWAGAWAMSPDFKPVFPVIPAGEIQREMAYRFGVNVTIFAMTGTYKNDQLHINAILDRLGAAR